VAATTGCPGRFPMRDMRKALCSAAPGPGTADGTSTRSLPVHAGGRGRYVTAVAGLRNLTRRGTRTLTRVGRRGPWCAGLQSAHFLDHSGDLSDQAAESLGATLFGASALVAYAAGTGDALDVPAVDDAEVAVVARTARDGCDTSSTSSTRTARSFKGVSRRHCRTP